ncbi:MAG: anti-sigma factor domain-containing protein [Almyronema sp.]
MSRSELPDNWQDLLAGQALGNLSPAEAEQLQRLLLEKPELAAELSAYQATWAMLAYAPPLVSPAARLQNKLLAAARVSSGFAEAESPAPAAAATQGFKFGVVAKLAGAIATVALLGLGLDNLRLRQQLAVTQQLLEQERRITPLRQQQQALATVVTALRQPNVQVLPLEGVGSAVGAAGSLLMVPDQSQLTLVAINLPPLPVGQVYRLWFLAERPSQAIYCGQFNNRLSNTARWTAPAAVCRQLPEKLLLTVDGENDPLTSAGPLVMQSKTS